MLLSRKFKKMAAKKAKQVQKRERAMHFMQRDVALHAAKE